MVLSTFIYIALFRQRLTAPLSLFAHLSFCCDFVNGPAHSFLLQMRQRLTGQTQGVRNSETVNERQVKRPNLTS